MSTLGTEVKVAMSRGPACRKVGIFKQKYITILASFSSLLPQITHSDSLWIGFATTVMSYTVQKRECLVDFIG